MDGDEMTVEFRRLAVGQGSNLQHPYPCTKFSIPLLHFDRQPPESSFASNRGRRSPVPCETEAGHKLPNANTLS